MIQKMRRSLRNMSLSTLVCLSVSLAVAVPLLVASLLFYFKSQSYLLRLEGSTLHAALVTLSPPDGAELGDISPAVEQTVACLSGGKPCSWYILDSGDTIAASGCTSGNIFPLEQYPSPGNLNAGYLVHTNPYRGKALYLFSRLNAAYSLVVIYPTSNLSGAWQEFAPLIPAALLLALIFTGLALLLLRVYFITPAKNLLHTMRNPSMEAKITAYTGWSSEIGTMCTSYLERFREYHDSLEEINRLNAEQRTSEIEVLQNQINAHFIYNTLNNIQWLASANRMDDVVHTAQSLDILLRACARNDSDYVTIEEEMTYVDAYLSSQKIRFNDVFDYEFRLDPLQMQMKIPKFIVQPIVENSIYHGFLDAGRTNGHIRVSLFRRGYRIVIEVFDNGVGIAAEDIFPILNNTQKSSDRYMGVAIGNINKRIRLLCGREYGIGIESQKEQFTKVQIIVPIIP